MYGARAVLNQVVQKYPEERVSLHVIWLPMVPGDDEEAARSTGEMYAGHAVHQYYDAERDVGRAYHRDVFPDCAQAALSVTPDDHPLREALTEWSAATPGERPLWDAVLFYPPGAEWGTRAPRPAAWSKQVGFFGGNPGDVTGLFFRNDCKQPPVESDWHREISQAMESPAVASGERGSIP